MKEKKKNLKRALGLMALIVYGVGDILGAGIYAIMGQVAGHAGVFAWVSFLIALIVALFTASSYAELGSRYPKSGGASAYIEEAFEKKWLSILTGWLVFAAVVVSMATLSQAFIGYARSFGWGLQEWIGLLIFFSVLFYINFRGIRQSSWANMVSTGLEVGGLFIVIGCGLWYLYNLNEPLEWVAGKSSFRWLNIVQGTAIAFFAFTGFEDLANIAEEVKNPVRNLPRAILIALGTAGLLYMVIAWVSTAVISPEDLGASDSPLLDVVNKAYPPLPPLIFTVIAIFAVTNTALLNYITASRLLYGMANENLLPKWFTKVHSRYSTPYVAILAILPIVLILSLIGSLGTLASSTSALNLCVFTLINVALIKVKSGRKKEEKSYFAIPFAVPWIAILLNIITLTFLPGKALLPAALIISLGLLISAIITYSQRKK